MKPLWTPSLDKIANSPLEHFRQKCETVAVTPLPNYDALHDWSVKNLTQFWDLIWDNCSIIGHKQGPVIINEDKMPGAVFFPEAKINFAENLLWKQGNGDALIFRGEDKVETRLSWNQLRDQVSCLQQAFKDLGVRKGDRICAMMPNMSQTIVAMLAATSLGAVWSSCSPDFGEQGILDRFGQIEPVLFIGCDGYWYNGKRIDTGEKISAVMAKLPVKTCIIVDYLGESEAIASSITNGVTLHELMARYQPQALEFERFDFNHPLYILFSSGTTGIPKCIVHGAGGTLLQHAKELRLHSGVRENDRLFYFTTCGWMMWNWMVSGLSVGATLALYDGSPFYPNGNCLFDYAQDEAITFFGTSAKFIDALRKSGLEPIKTHDLSALRTMASTGSPLSPEGFEFVYTSIHSDIHLASISGGTDIAGCFVTAIDVKPVYSGEIQGPALALAVDVWDDEGMPLRAQKGELVCTKPFPSMPVYFYNDTENHKYHAAYFERYDNIWHHGDFAEITPRGGVVIHGRSDATLNPGGVRIGTAEIYNQVEQLDEIIEAICIGQDWNDDTRLILFVCLKDGIALDDELEAKIRHKIRTGATPRHVPAKIIAVSDIPRTKSGKITEIAVRDVVHGRTIKNREALANPESLELFKDIKSLSN